ncbi:MAG: ThuA domain-containing protein, partial [Clostridiales bacterium]|nr:ThuA domain-containing protein [Clostridiales bacterium]
MQVVMLKQITADELMQYDVLYVGGGAFEQPDLIRAVKTFVNCGGGLILTHSACGRNRPETIFPSIVSKVIDRRADTRLRVKDVSHPLTSGLPQEFEHGYIDHLYLAAGPDGVGVLIDSEGADTAVAGQVGAGRVVFNGALPGYWYDPADFRQGEKEPEGAELQWVLNTINWAAGKKRLTCLSEEELADRRRQA